MNKSTKDRAASAPQCTHVCPVEWGHKQAHSCQLQQSHSEPHHHLCEMELTREIDMLHGFNEGVRQATDIMREAGFPELAHKIAKLLCPTDKTRSDKGKHHRVAGVLQEDVDEAEN